MPSKDFIAIVDIVGFPLKYEQPGKGTGRFQVYLPGLDNYLTGEAVYSLYEKARQIALVSLLMGDSLYLVGGSSANLGEFFLLAVDGRWGAKKENPHRENAGFRRVELKPETFFAKLEGKVRAAWRKTWTEEKWYAYSYHEELARILTGVCPGSENNGGRVQVF